MGNLINPTSFRLGSTKFWNSTWALTSNINYSFLNLKNIMLTEYLQKLLEKITSIYFKHGFLIGSLKFIQNFNFVNILLYFKFDKLVDFNTNINILLNKQLKILNNTNKQIKLPLKKYSNYKNENNFKNYFSVTKNIPFMIDVATPDNNALIWDNSITNLVKFNLKKDYLSSALYSSILKEISKYMIQNYLFKNVKNFLINSLKNFWYTKILIPNLYFIAYDLTAVTSASISRFVIVRLKQRFPARNVVNSLLKQMKQLRFSGTILGFKITCSGRFARRGRASFIWEDTGKIGENVLKLDVDYNLSLVTLVNSICGIKIWIIKSKQPAKQLVI